MFILINSENLQIEFDPVQVVKQYHPSIAFDITTSWRMPYQQAKIEIKECWIEEFELNQFQRNLQVFIENSIQSLELKNPSLKTILHLYRIDEQIFLELKAQDTVEIGTIILKTQLYHQELIEIVDNIKEWDKWW